MAEYLDKTGLTYLCSKIKEKFDAKADKTALDAKADKTTADALGKRIDNLILSSGTESSAEVVDARTGYDGTAHDTLGTAIRKQVSELKGDLGQLSEEISERTINLYNKRDQSLIYAGYYADNNGNFTQNENATSIIVPCEENTQYTVCKKVTSVFRVADYASKPVLTSRSISTPKESNDATSITFATGAGAKWLAVYLFNARYDTDITSVLDTVQVEKGATAHEYMPFRTANDAIARSRIINTENIADMAVTAEKAAFIQHVEGTNYIPGWVDNAYIYDGAENTYEGFFATLPVYLTAGVQYYYGNLYAGYYAFYDVDGNVIEHHNINDAPPNPFTPPAGTKYARFTATTASMRDSGWISTENTHPTSYRLQIDANLLPAETRKNCDYQGKDFSLFRKCLCIGDSTTAGVFNYKDGEYNTQGYLTLTDGYSYPVYLNKISGVECVNMGESSATIDEWWAHHDDVGMSGYDVAVIALGINDKFRYGGWTEAAETALLSIINALQSANNNIKIFVCTIIPIYAGDDYDAISQGIRDVVASANENVALVDLAKYSHLTESVAYDNGHPSAYGYMVMAKDIHNCIGYIMSKNKTDYRNVQFIGTEHYY